MGPRLQIAAALVLLGLGFGYGFLSHRQKVFPYPLLKSLFGSEESTASPWVDGFSQARQGELTKEQLAEIKRLSQLGYAAHHEGGKLSGVTRHVPGRAFEGLNLVIDGDRAQAWLMDMQGVPVHTWQYEFARAFPDVEGDGEAPGQGYWRRVALLDDGSLIGIYEGQGIVKIDRDSELQWAVPVGAHHDLQVLPDGTIYFLERHVELLPRIHPSDPILHDSIVVLDANGKEIRRVSILEAVENSTYFPLLHNARTHTVLFHTNTLEVLDGSLADSIPAFRAGNVLISMAKIDAIAVLNMDEPSIEWAIADRTSFQHQPTILPNGRMMVFDNWGQYDGSGEQRRSRVIELDPTTLEIPWSYAGGDPPLFTMTCGSAQRLPNGNTLITESDYGRALEVTQEGEIVWEYYTDNRSGANDELIATLFEVIRIPRPDWLPR